MYALSRVLSYVLLACAATVAAAGEKVVFQTPQLGANLGVWRLTHDPTVRHHANYHNTQCWSPDGRYVCYTDFGASGSESTATVYVYDCQADRTREIGKGDSPRWAKHHNWLFYVDYSKNDRRQRTSDIVWVDLDSDRRTIIAPGPGPEMLGETDSEDRWLYGALRFRRQEPEFQVIRIHIRPEGGYDKLPEVQGSQLLPNPRHPVFFTRQDHKNDPFAATRWWYDLSGANRRIGVPTLQQCHMCWLGNGEYMLLGNGFVRGRRWNEPFPSDVHILAAVGVGDVSPCGVSGRYVCGDHMVADLRSGDGWKYIEPLSIICYPQSVADDSGIYDADPKGSPDGTKICFVSNYDLARGPMTQITEVTRDASRLVVKSTAGFPSAGAVVVQREVIGYRRKTATSFEGLVRQLHDTAKVSLAAGRSVTSFEARCLSDSQWRQMGRANAAMRKSIGSDDSPLLRQRQTDVYVALVRRPDRPWLVRQGEALHLVPGENHAETAGYRLLKDGRPVDDKLLKPGAARVLAAAGEYRAVAVEWSGLASEPSNAVRIGGQASLAALAEPAGEFSWVEPRWADAGKTVRETVHRYDGVIRREWFAGQELQKAHDLNRDGKAIRRVEYRDGRPAIREYYSPDDVRVSREVFDDRGGIAETIRFRDDGSEDSHWWFEGGMPVKAVRGPKTYIKRGERFGRMEGDRFVDTPRGPLSE